MTTRALVVDDSKVDRLLIGGLLEKEGDMEVSYANHGAEALAKVKDVVPDIVLTDLLMPEMDGLQLVAELKEKYPLVPVVLVTSNGSEEVAVRALQEGAASYVPKRTLARDLLDVVDEVLEACCEQRNRSELMQWMTRNDSSFVLNNDRQYIGPLVSYLMDSMMMMGLCGGADRTRISIALEEALVNAVEHGNLELDSGLREADRLAYERLARERRLSSPYKDRRVQVEASFSRSEAQFVVRDEGSGFDHSSLPNPTDPQNLLKSSGRGLLLMRAFMDEVIYNKVGNEVRLIKKHEVAPVVAGG